jgi:hypothetical protein
VTDPDVSAHWVRSFRYWRDMQESALRERDMWKARAERAEARKARLREALQKLYDYTVALERHAGAFLITHSGKFPEGGEEAGELTRAALADTRTEVSSD